MSNTRRHQNTIGAQTHTTQHAPDLTRATAPSLNSLGLATKPERTAHNTGITGIPQVVAHGAPLAIVEDLHTTLVVRVTARQPYSRKG